jgi:hypothetical protein
MVAVTERWEVEELAPCVRCCYPTTTAPVPRGVVVAGGILCDDCRFHLIHIGEWGEYLARLTRPEDDGPDGGPAAPAVRPVNLNLIAFGAGPVYELSDEELAEWHDFLRAVDEDQARCPLEECQTCRRPVSPLIEGECLTCRGELEPPTGPTRPWPDRAALVAVWVDTLMELAEAKTILARIDARLERIRQGASTGRM